MIGIILNVQGYASQRKEDNMRENEAKKKKSKWNIIFSKKLE